MSLLLEIGIGVGILLNTGLLWSVATKVGWLDGKMEFVCKKIEEHNALNSRLVTLETKEKMRGQSRET